MTTPGQPKEINAWREEMSKIPQFLYWTRVLDLQRLCLQFVRALREGNFDLYVQTLTKIAPWMFALDHTNYSRWLPVHIRDMCELPVKHPKVFEQFNAGAFVVQKTRHTFSFLLWEGIHKQKTNQNCAKCLV